MVKPLTAAAARRLRPGPKRRRIRDGGARSLFLVIEPSGHKAFQMRFRTPTGRIGKLTLGPLHLGTETAGPPVVGMPLTLAGARQLAAEVHRQRALGTDPVADHKARRHRARVAIEERKASSFAAAVRNYIEEHAKPKTRNWRETARLLGLRYPKDGGEPEPTHGGLVARWGDKPVRDVDDHDVFAVIDEARRISVPGLEARSEYHSDARARGLFVAVSSLFAWAQRRRLVEVNPCRSVPRPAGAMARDRVLSKDEIRWFWQACDSADAPRAPDAPQPFAPLLRLLLVTGQRLGEVAGMTREELHADGMWHLPGRRTKNGKTHVVPLPPAARELIDSMPGNGDLIFSTTGTTPVSGWGRMKRRLDAAMLNIARQERGAKGAIAAWRLHDLRRTCITGMAELGIRPDVIELTVNHVSGSRGGIAGVYNRSELLDERRVALERWSRHIAGLVAGKPVNVAQLHKARP
jgi:integrase